MFRSLTEDAAPKISELSCGTCKSEGLGYCILVPGQLNEDWVNLLGYAGKSLNRSTYIMSEVISNSFQPVDYRHQNSLTLEDKETTSG